MYRWDTLNSNDRNGTKPLDIIKLGVLLFGGYLSPSLGRNYARCCEVLGRQHYSFRDPFYAKSGYKRLLIQGFSYLPNLGKNPFRHDFPRPWLEVEDHSVEDAFSWHQFLLGRNLDLASRVDENGYTEILVALQFRHPISIYLYGLFLKLDADFHGTAPAGGQTSLAQILAHGSRLSTILLVANLRLFIEHGNTLSTMDRPCVVPAGTAVRWDTSDQFTFVPSDIGHSVDEVPHRRCKRLDKRRSGKKQEELLPKFTGGGCSTSLDTQDLMPRSDGLASRHQRVFEGV